MTTITPTRRPGLRAALERRWMAVADAMARRPAWPTLLALAAAFVGAGVSLGSVAPLA